MASVKKKALYTVAAGQGWQIRQCRPRNLFEKNTIQNSSFILFFLNKFHHLYLSNMHIFFKFYDISPYWRFKGPLIHGPSIP
jgi:hypothetical protein